MCYLGDYAVDRQNGRLTESTSFAYSKASSFEGVKSCTLIKAQQQEIPLNESKTQATPQKSVSVFFDDFIIFSGIRQGTLEEEKKRGISILMDFIVFLFSLPRTKET